MIPLIATIQAICEERTHWINVESFGSTLAEILAGAGISLNTRCNHRGLCKGCHVTRTGASTENLLACDYRLKAGEQLKINIPGRSLLAHVPAAVSDFKTGIPVGSDPIFKTTKPLGIALDIGTTTVALLLAELSSGRVLGKVTALNAQVSLGDNVLTRIQLCQDSKSNVEILKNAFWQKTFHPLLRDLLKQSGAKLEDIAGLVVSANTTMLHLACGADPTPMGQVPFTPAFLDQRQFEGSDFGLPNDCLVVFLPGISAYVGADISSGAVCCGMGYEARPCLLVDVGTNGEILLSGPNGLLACATAAGPAFEGCGLLCGMRAANGVVSRIECATDPFEIRFEMIGGNDVAPHGITGSAYIDFLAEGRRIGLLEENGRFNRDFVTSYPDQFKQEKNGLSLLLGPADLRIGEVDVALLLQAKAAIAAGIETVLTRQGITASAIHQLYLAGGFGLHLSVPNAIACGLLPGFCVDQIKAVGNTSLGGAYLAMLDGSLAAEMDLLRGEVSTLELNLDPHFEDRYVDHLFLPSPCVPTMN